MVNFRSIPAAAFVLHRPILQQLVILALNLLQPIDLGSEICGGLTFELFDCTVIASSHTCMYFGGDPVFIQVFLQVRMKDPKFCTVDDFFAG